jgi:uncharacterized protein
MILPTLAGKFRLVLALLAIPLLLAAQPDKKTALKDGISNQLKPAGYVNDFAGIFNVESTRRLNALCETINRQAKAQIAVVTIESLDDADIESFAADLFKQWGIGGKSSNRGVLVLLVVRDRSYRIEVGYGLEPILPDGKVGGFGREAVPALKQGDYNGAAQLLVWHIADTIATDAGVTLGPELLPDVSGSQQPATRPATRPPSSDSIPTGVILAGLAVLVIILGIAGAIGGWGAVFNVLFFILNIVLSSGEGSSGSSSGGFGSGGGFGGFGGGSSGGGGASGKW